MEPLPDDQRLVTLGVTEPFTTSVKVSLIAGLALAVPVLLWQSWAFLAPAVEPHFQRVVLVLIALGTGLFASGVAFMYYVVLPRALDFLTTFDDGIYDNQIRASYYLTFVSWTLLAGGSRSSCRSSCSGSCDFGCSRRRSCAATAASRSSPSSSSRFSSRRSTRSRLPSR